MQLNSALDELNAIPGFTDRSKLFIRDLRCFGRDQDAQNRLNGTKHEYYLGGVYFNNSIIKKIVELPVGNGTLRSDADNRGYITAATYVDVRANIYTTIASTVTVE